MLTYHRMSVACSVDIWSCFVYLGMDCESSGIDRLISNDYLAIFVDEYQIGHAYLREVFGQWVEPCSISKADAASGFHTHRSDQSGSGRER